MANFFIIIFFFFLSCLVCTLAQRDIAINCGSAGISTSFSGKEWIGDDHLTTSSIVIKGSSTTTLHKFVSNDDPIPYQTARISITQFSYTFQVSPGQKLIRLYFRPSSFKHFKNFKDLFTIKAGPFTFLRNFSVSLTCDALGVESFVKEYYITIEQDQTLNIIFDPEKIKSGKTYALVNGIEVISMATDFYYSGDGDGDGDDELGARVVGQKSRFYIDSSIALEMMQRLSFRWDPIVLIDEKAKDFRWKTSVDVGFGYLVRLHFCETCNTVFNLFINDMIAETNVDIGRERSLVNGIYRHRDYVVMVKGPKEEGRRDLSISLQLKNGLVSELFKGLEIFKLSNNENSLASPNLYFPRRRDSKSSTLLNMMSIFGHGNAIVTGAVLVISFVNIIAYKLRKIWEASSTEEINKPLAWTGKLCRPFSLAQMQLATENFNDALVIGKGGFGNVYRGIISNGQQVVAIKRLKSNSKQGMSEFWTEVEILSKLHHTNLISLIGYCNESEEMILVYEYIPGGTLADHLFPLNNCISWKQRLSICIGVGRGLDYLHTGTDREIIHRDIKASNILLDENLEAKISDFGLAKPRKRKQLQNFVNTNVKGTFGYFDPNYFRTRKLTRKSDIYAFGVVLLEVLCGRPPLDIRVEEEKQSLTIWAQGLICKGETDEIIASSLKAQITAESLMTFVELAQRCLYDQPNKRPTMAQVVVQLEYALEQQEKTEMTSFESLNPCTRQTTQSIRAETTFVDDEYEHNKKIPIVSSVTEESNTKSKMALNAEPSNKGVLASRRKTNPYKPPHFWPWDTLWKKPRPTKKNNLSVSEYFGKEVESYKFDLSTIVAATNNFSIKIGEGGFCNVYKGVLSTGQVVAVKRYKSPKTFTQEELFKREVLLVSKLEHPNLVRLVGYCFHDEERIIVYEFMENQGLNAHIFGETRRPNLGWTICFKIIVGIARGIHYLHQDSGLGIIHRDINRNNILLDKEMNPKISGFSLGRTLEEDQTQVRIFGTYGYMAPEYCREGLLSVKTDVFGFGAVVLEIVSGKRIWNSYFDLFESAWKMWKEGNAIKLLDKSIQDEGTHDEALKCIQVGLLCIQDRPDDRPTMQYVVEMLEGGDPPLPQPSKPAYVYSRLKLSTESTNKVTITK